MVLKEIFLLMKMFYWTGVTEKMIPLKLNNIGYELPLNEYMDWVQPILPKKDECD